MSKIGIGEGGQPAPGQAELRVVTDGSIKEYVQQRLDCAPFEERSVEVGIFVDDVLQVGIVYDNFGIDDNDRPFAYMNIAKEGATFPLAPVLRDIFDHAYDVMGVDIVCGIVGLLDVTTQGFAASLGATNLGNRPGRPSDWETWSVAKEDNNFYRGRQ